MSKNGGNSGNDGRPGHEETSGPGGGSDINQQSIVEARIIKSVNEKRDKEILAKIKSFHDLKDKRRATEENEKKIQLALEEVRGLIDVNQDSLRKMKDVVGGGLGLGVVGLGAVSVGTLGLGAAAVGGLAALGGVGVIGGLGALGGLASWGHKKWNLATLSKQRQSLETELEELQNKTTALQGLIDSLPEAPSPDERMRRREELDAEIALKEEELECWCCYATCSPPIYTCRSQHPICSRCRARLDKCGLCKMRFEGKQRHRYAERDHQQLVHLRLLRETAE